MKNNTALNSLLRMFLILFASLMIVSCGDDEENTEVSGCTDSTADNFNPSATMDDGSCTYSGCTDMDAENYDPNATNDDGSCVYARDKFLGSYLGMFICPGQLEFIGSDSLVFSIQPALDPDNKNGVLLELTLASSPVPISLEGTVSGDVLSISSTLMGIPVPIPNFGTFNADVTGTGTAEVDADGNLIGNVSVEVAVLGQTFSDSCSLIGAKQ